MANTHKHHKMDRAFLRAIKPTGNWQEFSDSVLRGESHPGRSPLDRLGERARRPVR